MSLLPCPSCYAGQTKVKDSRLSREPIMSIRRRRHCPLCGYRWTTFEVGEEMMSKVHRLARLLGRVRRDLNELDFHEVTDSGSDPDETHDL